MSDFYRIAELGQRIRTRWNQRRLARDIDALSPELRKDIGWPAGNPTPTITTLRQQAGQSNLGSLR